MTANIIPTHQIVQFATNIELLLQQKGSVLRSTVDSGSYVGKQASPVDQIGSVAARLVTTRFAPLVRTDAPTDRRWIYPYSYDLTQQIDTFDKLKVMNDPSSKLVQAAVYAMGCAMDDQIINAFFGTAATGEQGGTSTVFPTSTSTNVISVNTGGTASGINVAKLRLGRRYLRQGFVDFDNDPIYQGITAKQEDELLNEIQVVSLDFNDKPVLTDGKLRSFLGLNFVHCERFTTGTDDAAGTSYQLPMWARSGMHLGIWQDMLVDVDRRKDLSGLPWQVYVCGTFGATRLQEPKVMKVWCR
jgi:hypothetical protein